MAIYHAKGSLDFDFEDIEADSPEEAFIIASDAAMSGGSWYYEADEIRSESEEE